MSQYSQDYAMKELQAAVQSLEGDGDPRKKLLSASVYHLIHVNPENLPERSREPMSEILQALFYGQAEGYDGIAEASIAAMTDLQVSGMIESILQIGSWTRISMSSSLIDRLTAEAEADAPDHDAEGFLVYLQTDWNWSTDIFPDLEEEVITTGRTLNLEAEVPFFEGEEISAVLPSNGSVIPTIHIGANCKLEPPFTEAAARRFFVALRVASDKALDLLAGST